MVDHISVPELARLHHEELRHEVDERRRVALLGRRSPRRRAAALLLTLAFRLVPSITELVEQAAGVEHPAEAARPA
ncbi:MAG TPA: hypothetical protein VFW96_15870 [Thermomicrobiales bacterium]|nr:hypothetical protein [Thermomicrobiales bacterium]